MSYSTTVQSQEVYEYSPFIEFGLDDTDIVQLLFANKDEAAVPLDPDSPADTDQGPEQPTDGECLQVNSFSEDIVNDGDLSGSQPPLESPDGEVATPTVVETNSAPSSAEIQVDRDDSTYQVSASTKAFVAARIKATDDALEHAMSEYQQVALAERHQTLIDVARKALKSVFDDDAARYVLKEFASLRGYPKRDFGYLNEVLESAKARNRREAKEAGANPADFAPLDDGKQAANPHKNDEFTPSQVAYHQKRANSIAYLKAHQLVSLTLAGAQKYFGDYVKSGGTLLIYPRDRVPHPYAKLHLDDREATKIKGQSIKAIVPKGVPVQPYIPPETKETGGVLGIFESPTKALASLESGVFEHAIGLNGVSGGYLEKDDKDRYHVMPCLLPFLANEREVAIVFDAGRELNHQVALAEAKLAYTLSTESSARVFVVELPLDNAKDRGVDDFLQKEGPDVLRAIVAKKRPARPSKWAKEVLDTDGLEAATELLRHLPFIASLYQYKKAGDRLELATTQSVLRAVKGVTLKTINDICKDFGSKLRALASRSAQNGRPKIMVTPDHAVVVADFDKVLGDQTGPYRFGDDKFVRVIGTKLPSIQPVPVDALVLDSTKLVYWAQKDSNGDVYQVDPPFLIIKEYMSSPAYWRSIKEIKGVAPHPVFRADGSVTTKPGYDEATGLFITDNFGSDFWVCETPSIIDARRAANKLLSLIDEFPWDLTNPRLGPSVWIANLLTILARDAIDGPVPAFLYNKNIKGTGATLLVDSIGMIALGSRLPKSSWSSDEEEQRKSITGDLMAGERIILYDNIASYTPFGGRVIDELITCGVWKDRILGGNEHAKVPNLSVIIGTGNNVSLTGDIGRRVLCPRLESDEERPWERRNFKIPNLSAHILANRPELLRASFTILRAFHVAGRPKQDTKPFGGFEGFRALIAAAIKWVGLEDPILAQMDEDDAGTSENRALAAIFNVFAELDPRGKGMTANEIADKIRGGELKYPTATEFFTDKDGRFLSAQRIGQKLNRFRGQMVSGKKLYKEHDDHRNIYVWSIRTPLKSEQATTDIEPNDSTVTTPGMGSQADTATGCPTSTTESLSDGVNTNDDNSQPIGANGIPKTTLMLKDMYS